MVFNMVDVEKNRLIFYSWVHEYNPNAVTRLVLGNLVDKYSRGDVDSIFAKMSQLIDDEHYELCVHFKSLFNYMGLMDEFLVWEELNK
jgi:hypothetical protein